MTSSSDSDHGRLMARFGRRFAAGEVIFQAGDPAEEAYLLQEGRVRLIKQVGTAERSLRVVRPGDLFGESALSPGATRGSTAVALVDATALALEQSTFRQVVSGNPAVMLRVLQQLVRRLRAAEDQIEVLMLRDSQAKVVVALLQLARESLAGAEDQTEVSVNVSPMELSARVGMDVDTVKRNVQQLRNSQYIEIQGEQIYIRDLDALRELRSLLDAKDQILGGSAAPIRSQS